MIRLQPPPDRPEYELMVEEALNKYFYSVIYGPIVKIYQESGFEDKLVLNASSYLLDAILKGKIQYSEGKFSGAFNAKLSKELKSMGAAFSSKFGTWRIPEGKLPIDTRQAVARASGKFKKLHDDILGHIQEVRVDDSLSNLSVESEYKKIIKGLDKDYKEIARNYAVPAQLTETAIISLADDYSNNMKLYIKGWTQDHIERLREKVYQNTFEGGRASNLVKMIQDQYGVSKSKAKFLARQETGLLTGKFTKSRYEDMGVRKWQWSSSLDSRVRPLHKELHGKVFPMESPPVIDEKGTKGYPREAFQCRCRMVALLD